MTRKQVIAALEVVKVIGETIRDLTEAKGGVQSGHLYTRLMATGIGLAGYERAIQALKDAGLVEEKAYWLKWIGPAREER